MTWSRYGAGLVLVALLAQPALAERDIEIISQPERSTASRVLIGSLLGAGLAVGGLGAYYHLDSRDAADEVSTKDFTGMAWTSEDEALVDRAARSGDRATIAYGIGGALLVGTAIAIILTEPKAEVIVIKPRGPVKPAPVTPTVTPAEGGAMLGGRWSF